MHDRLLNAYLVGTVEEVVFKAKSNKLKTQAAQADQALVRLGDVAPSRGERALDLFDWSQRAADVWRGSNNALRREILDCLCLNRTLSDVSLCLAKRKPFDVLAEGPKIKNSRGDWTPIELFRQGAAAIEPHVCRLIVVYARHTSPPH